MTLLLESAIRAFDREAATPCDPDESALRRGTPVEFSLATVYRFARHYDTLTPPDRPEWTCLPLHAPDGAALSGEYVVYTDHDVHGEIVVHGDGEDRDFLSVEAFAETPLARRLRFFHPDNVPEPAPEYYEAPFDDREPPRERVDPEAFFDGVAEYLEHERTAAVERRREAVADADPRTLYDDGEDALPALRSQGVDGTTVTFGIEFDRLDVSERAARRRHHVVSEAFGIYPDDPVLVVPPDRAHSPDGLPAVGTVEETSTSRVTVALEPGVESVAATRRYLREDRVGYGLVKLLNPLPFDRRAEAVETVRRDRTFRAVLTGQRPLTFTQPRAADSTRKDDALNQEQRAAVKYALLADDLFCVHGPPGTGKTRTLVEVVRRAVEAGERVLVCADSNQAVDNLLVGESTPGDPDPGSLHAHGQHGTGELTIDRRNVRRSSHDHVPEWYADAPADAAVVAATNGSAAAIDRRFDLAVIDEATQTTTVTSMVPLSKADTVVLAGDHRQLPPFSRTESPPDAAVGLSLFEHVYTDGGVFEGVGLQLRTQYRMHRDIAYFPNREFYDRSLRTGLDVDPLPDRPPVVGYDIGGLERREGTSYANPTEARLVAHLVDRLCADDGLDPADVGVITPYAAQVRTVESALADRLAGADRVTVDTVDAFQGSERAAILVSFARSNDDGRIGFLGRPADGPRRLNVAMTRAQRCCVLVGDWSTLRTEPDGEDVTDLYDDLASHLEDTGRMRRFDPDLLG